jgi:hypothetical protein
MQIASVWHRRIAMTVQIAVALASVAVSFLLCRKWNDLREKIW